MTEDQRAKTKLALRRYGTRQWACSPANVGWRRAIERTMDYYQQTDPTRADLMRLRYFERRTEDDTIERLHIGRSTYQKAQTDLLSTVAVYAARSMARYKQTEKDSRRFGSGSPAFTDLFSAGGCSARGTRSSCRRSPCPPSRHAGRSR